MREHQAFHEYQEQGEIISHLMKPQPTVIAVEGGPCSGKTTLIKRLQQTAGERQVVCLPEAATEHIMALAEKGVDVSDIELNDRPAWVEFETAVLRTIVNDIEEAKRLYADTDTIIVIDRCDIGAYVTANEHRHIQAALGLSMAPMLSHVDQVYYLPSVASIDPAIYHREKANNPARLESLEKAQAVCERNLQAVGRHPELHVAWGGDFHETIDDLVEHILKPELESEIKVRPITDGVSLDRFLASGTLVSTLAIEQTYHEFGETVYRLRRTMTEQGEEVHFFTVKTGHGRERHEVQRRIDPETYWLLRQLQQVGESLLKERTTVLTQDDGTKKRAWALDRYHDRRLPEWNIETDVRSDEEAERVLSALPEFIPAQYSAEQLARQLGAYSMRV